MQHKAQASDVIASPDLSGRGNPGAWSWYFLTSTT